MRIKPEGLALVAPPGLSLRAYDLILVLPNQLRRARVMEQLERLKAESPEVRPGL